MSKPSWDREYSGHAEFYNNVYGHAIREVRTAGRNGAAMLHAEQEAGDWSDAPSPDLVVSVNQSNLHGRATLDLGGGAFVSRSTAKDQFFVVPPSYATTVMIDTRHALKLIAIPWARFLESAGEDAGLPHDGDFGHLHGSAQSDPEITQNLDRLWAEGARGNPHGALWADGALLQLVSRLLVLRDGPQRVSQAKGGLAPWQVRRVSEYLEDHLDQDVTLADLGALLGLSTFHLCRAFRQSTGLPPHRWRQQRRMERARELLEGTDLSITEIAAAVGYDGPSRFALGFRKAFGLSPRAYRRERRS